MSTRTATAIVCWFLFATVVNAVFVLSGSLFAFAWWGVIAVASPLIGFACARMDSRRVKEGSQ